MEKMFCVEFMVDSRWLAGVEATMAYAWASWTQGECCTKFLIEASFMILFKNMWRRLTSKDKTLCIIVLKKFKKIVVQINENLSWVCIDLTKRSF